MSKVRVTIYQCPTCSEVFRTYKAALEHKHATHYDQEIAAFEARCAARREAEKMEGR